MIAFVSESTRLVFICTYLAKNQYYFKVNYLGYNIYLFQGMGYYVPVGNNSHTPYLYKLTNDRHIETDLRLLLTKQNLIHDL